MFPLISWHRLLASCHPGISWVFAHSIRTGSRRTFGIFDALSDEAGRKSRRSGKVAAALMARAGELFSDLPSIEKMDVFAAMLPS